MVQFCQSIMGRKFYDGDVPRMIRALEKIADKTVEPEKEPTDIRKRSELGYPKDRVLALLINDLPLEEKKRLRDEYCRSVKDKARDPKEIAEWGHIIDFLDLHVPK